MKKYDVFGIGNALMDTLIRVDEIDIEDLNLKKGNMHLVDNIHLDFILTFFKNKKIKKAAGGSVSNTVAGVAMFGGSAFFNGKIGKDKLGQTYKNIMIKQGVACDLKKTDNTTGNVLSLITKDCQRTFATYLGAAVQFVKKDVNASELAKSKILHLEGYMLEDSQLKKASLYAIKIAKKNKIDVSVDLSDPALILRNLKEFKLLIKNSIDILFLNEEEAHAFTGISNPKQALLKIPKSVKLAIVKLGEDGSLIRIKNKIIKIDAFKPKQIVDTTGAGDMYAAGVLYGITNKLTLEDAGKLGSYAASKIVSQTGARLERKLSVKKILG